MKKTQTIILSLTVIAALAFTISSCDPKQNTAPVIDIEEPLASDTILLGDSVHVEGTVTDDESLHELMVTVTNATGGTVFQSVPTVHDLKTYSFHYHVTPLSTGTHTLTVIAEDHEEKSATATRTFVVN